MVERCIFVVCLDTRVSKTGESNSANKENVNSKVEKKISQQQMNGNNNGDEKASSSPCDSCYEERSSMPRRAKAAHQMLHGFGSKSNSGNRWFDKTMQFIISEDGECGINYEHSPAEGIVVIELSEHLFRYMY